MSGRRDHVTAHVARARLGPAPAPAPRALFRPDHAGHGYGRNPAPPCALAPGPLCCADPAPPCARAPGPLCCADHLFDPAPGHPSDPCPCPFPCPGPCRRLLSPFHCDLAPDSTPAIFPPFLDPCPCPGLGLYLGLYPGPGPLKNPAAYHRRASASLQHWHLGPDCPCSTRALCRASSGRGQLPRTPCRTPCLTPCLTHAERHPP